jgi:hypothetical protein
MKVKSSFLRFGKLSIKNGTHIRFWEDQWLGTSSLRDQYPCLYHVVRHKQATMAQVLSSSPFNFSWRRDLIGPKLVAWNEMIPQIANITLTQEPDEFRWNLVPSGQFLVKSHYLALIHSDVPNLNKRLWKLKVLLKIKIFLWYLWRGVVLTKDNLAKCNWQCSVLCCFCHKDETIHHLFFDCPLARSIWSIIQVATNLYLPHSVSNMFGTWLWGIDKDLKSLVLAGAAAICWVIWRCRSDVVFDRKGVPSSSQVIYSAIHWLRT